MHNLSSFGLRFEDPHVEARFLEAQALESAPLIRLAMASGTSSWLLAHIFVAVALPQYLLVLSIALFGMVYPIQICTWHLCNKPAYRHHVQRMTVAANFAGTAALTWVVQIMAGETTLAAGGIVIIIFVGCTFQRLRVSYCAAMTAVDAIVYVGTLTVMHGRHLISGLDFAVGTVLVAIASSIGLQVSLILERKMRAGFVQTETITRQRKEIDEERARTEKLLLNILPQSIAARLKLNERVIADEFHDVTIIFADIVGFTGLAGGMLPRELVGLLNSVFSAFDELALRHGVEKIKTIGDAYMGAAGIPLAQPNHAEAAIKMGLGMLSAVEDLNARFGIKLTMRIGIHSGRAVAGVIGTSKFTYDLWGDAVNVAARMESHGVPGTIQVSSDTRALVGDSFRFEDRGVIEIKGKGPMNLFLLRNPIVTITTAT